MNQRKRPQKQQSEDETNMPAEESNNDWDDENSTTPSATPGMSDLTNEQRLGQSTPYLLIPFFDFQFRWSNGQPFSYLEHEKKLARNQVSSAYSSYDPPELSNQLDKFKCRMIAWRCKT
jgi:hypothetical protein